MKGESMYWKLALAQHPMYLIIREDSQCAERTPPCGEPTAPGKPIHTQRSASRCGDRLPSSRMQPGTCGWPTRGITACCDFAG